jgi:hypothetical protein
MLRNAFGSKVHTTSKARKTKNKPWFGPVCKQARLEFFIAKNNLKNNNIEANKIDLNKKSKLYKKCLNKYMYKSKQEACHTFRHTIKHSPKEFWKILNNKKNCNPPEMPGIESFFEYFRNIHQANDKHSDCLDEGLDPSNYDLKILNEDITIHEIETAVHQLKRNKASGQDDIENDYIIDSLTIKPIYKKKGDASNPSSYRPITILSCIGKLFTCILNRRLNTFLELNQIISPVQAGFRKGFSTIDNIFVLHMLSDILKQNKKKLYCAFIDFSKAFDKVWRTGLWHKLIKVGIEGRFLTLIKTMYQNIKSCVISNNSSSEYFPCNAGVRQGEHLSPLLFSIYLNDLEQYLTGKGHEGVNINTTNTDNSDLWINLIMLLYADDTVLLADTPDSLQHALNDFHEYCSTWKLEVNPSKTKILIFGSGPAKKIKLDFHINNEKIEIVDSYTYLGIEYHRNRRLICSMKTLVSKATKAMFCLLKKARNLSLPLDCIINAFDVMIVPILLYGCEIWGYENVNIIEKTHLKFLKLAAGLKMSTPSVMVYGELGRFPLKIKIQKK